MMKKIKNRILECYLCHIRFKCNKFSNLRRHFNLHGPVVKCFKCLECKQSFQNKSNANTHWKRAHKSLVEAGVTPKIASATRKAKSNIH